MPELHPASEPDPEPFFDPAAFFAERGDYERAAQHLHDGDVYPKSVLGLDAAGAAALRAALAFRKLVMLDAGLDWVFADAPDACPVCGQDAIPGRDTCGGPPCLTELGRRELARRRGRP